MIPYLELKKAVKKWGDKTLFITDMQTEISFKGLLDRVQKLAGALKDAGIGKGDVVAILLPNCIELVELYLAAGAVGAIFQPLDIRFRGTELKNALEHSHAKLFAVHIENMDNTESAIPADLPIKLSIHGDKEGWQSYEGFLESGISISPTDNIEIDQDNDDALYLFTSGSTGAIKCVPMTWRQLDYFPYDIINVVGMGPEDRGISLLPFSHISGPIVINLCLVSGTSCILTQRWRPDLIVDYFEKYKVTWAHTVPPMADLILKGRPETRDLSKVRFIALMGTSVPIKILQDMEQAIPSCRAIQGYGLTETNPMLTLLPLEMHELKRGSIGKPLNNVEIRVVNEQGNDVSIDETGELIVRGPKVFKGYLNNPDLNSKVIKNGWFYTGDIVKKDSEGFFYHLGRKDDIINTGGLKVYPAEIEAVLLKHHSVEDAVVYALPEKKRNYIITAEVVLQNEVSLNTRDLRSYMLKHLAHYKVPSNIEVVKAIHRSPIGKPIRQTGKAPSEEK